MKLNRLMVFCSAAIAACLFGGCTVDRSARSFSDDVAFLKSHRETIVLASADQRSKVAVVPSICGRVFTTTATGESGASYGFLNRDVIASKVTLPKINGYGGEDRFWLGPEGGQFAIFFDKGDQFTLDDWQTPAPIDTEAYRVTAQDKSRVTMTHDASFTNFSGNTLKVKIDRTVRLIDREAAYKDLGLSAGDLAGMSEFMSAGMVSCVAFETDNAITNTGPAAWTKETGMLSIWTLGMFKPSPRCTAVIPYQAGSVGERGSIVKDDYFGKVPGDRLTTNDHAIFFRADGVSRTKIGTSPWRSKSVCGSWDPELNVLTLVSFTRPAGATDYVNSMWEMQKEPFAGDVINNYNHAGMADGSPSFYELETSSPALALAPGQSGQHVSRTVHFTGPRASVDRVARATLGVSLDEIEKALPAKPRG